MVDRDRPSFLNLFNNVPQDTPATTDPIESNNVLNDYYDVEFGSTYDAVEAAQKNQTEKNERRKLVTEAALEQGLDPALLFNDFAYDITSITGRNMQGLRASDPTASEEEKKRRLRELQRDIATGGISYVAPDGDTVLFNEAGTRVGAFGLVDNIRANVRDSQALLGVAFLAPFLSDEVKSKLETIRSDLDTTYGVNPHLAQMRDSAIGAIHIGKDVTGEAKLKKEEVKSILSEAAPPSGEYTNEWLWSTLSSDPILSEMFSNAGVTRENTLGNVDQDQPGAFVKGMEAVAMRLYEHQRFQEQMALSESVQVGLGATLLDMIVQDPDFGAEIAIETGFTVLAQAGIVAASALGFIPTGGASAGGGVIASGALWSAYTLKWGNRLGRIAKKSASVKKKLDRLKDLRDAPQFGPLSSAARATHLLMRLKPGSLSMGGNIADLIVDTRKGLKGYQKQLIWAGGQTLDGVGGGISAHIASNIERKAVLSHLYNEGEDLHFMDGAGEAGLVSGVASLLLGGALKYGSRGVINTTQRLRGINAEDRLSWLGLDENNPTLTDYNTKQKELWMRIMDPSEHGDYDKASKAGFLGWIKGEDAGTKLLLAGARQKARQNILVSLLTDGQVTDVNQVRSKFGFTDSLANTIYEADLTEALEDVLRQLQGKFGDSFDDGTFPGLGDIGLRAALLRNNKFQQSLRNKDGDYFTSEEVGIFRDKHYAHLAHEEEKLGIDSEFQAIIKSIKDPVERSKAVAALIQDRIDEANQKILDIGNKETKALKQIDVDASNIEGAKAEIESLIPRLVEKLSKTDEGKRTALTMLENFRGLLEANSVAEVLDKIKKRSDLTDAQKESLSKIDDLVAGRVTLEKIDAINVESSLKDITNYAKARGVNLKEVTGRSKKNKRLKAIKNNLKSSNPEVKEKGIKELNEFIAEEQADTAKLLNKLEEAEQGVKDKVQRLGNERKRGKKREKISSIVSQTRSFLEERLEKLKQIQILNNNGSLNIDPSTQGDIPTNAGFRDSSDLIEEIREVELNKNFSKYSLEVKVNAALAEAAAKANGTVSRAVALDIFRGLLGTDHPAFKSGKPLDEAQMRGLLSDALQVLDEFEVTDRVIQNSITQRRDLYSTSSVEADLELEGAKAKEANQILKARLQGLKMEDPSRFVAPRIRSDAQATFETNNARATASRADYSVEEDVAALNTAIAKLENVIMKETRHAAVGNQGTGTRAAIMSLFKDTDLEDIDIDAVFGEALEDVGKSREFDQFNLEEVLRISKRRKNLGERYLGLKKDLERLDEKYTASYGVINKQMEELKTDLKLMASKISGKEPLLEGETKESLTASIEEKGKKLVELNKQREQLYLDVETAKAEANIKSEKTADQLRLEQSQLLTELRKQEAIESKNKSGKDFRGASSEEEWMNSFTRSLMRILTDRGDNIAKQFKTPEALEEYLVKTVVPYLPVSREIKNKGAAAIASLGNAELDWITPKTAAFAVRSMLRDEVDGTKRWDMEVTEFDNETNSYVTKKVKSEEVRHFSAVQPATDQQISKVLDQITYEAKVRAINEFDFDDPNGPSEAEIIAFIRDGNLRQNMSTAQDRSQLTIHADQIPPLVRTDIDRKLPEGKDYLDDYIDRTVEQMMELPPAHYSFIHDDLKGLKGQFGIRMEDVNTRAFFRYSIKDSVKNPWAEADPTGGFPVAIPLPDVDGNYSIAMAILDASAMLYPEMTPEILAAFRRGDNINKAAKDSPKGRGSALIAGQDGQNNGSRHQVAESIVLRRRNRLAKMSEQEAKDLIEGFLQTEGSTPEDFYTNLIVEVGKELDSDSNTFTPEVRNTLKALNRVGEGEFWRDGNKKSRDLAKQPLMIIPYGAQRRGVLGSLNAWFDDHPDYKKALQDAAKKSGTNYKTVLNQLTTSMLGNKNKSIDSLVEKASGMPDAADRLDAVLGMRDSLLPKVFDAKSKNYVEWDSKQGMEILYAEARSIAEKATESPTEKEIDVVFRALQIEAFANALLRKEQFDAMGKKINGIDEAMNTSRLHFIKELSVIEELTEARESGDIKRFNSLASKISGSKLTFFDRTTQTMNRTAFTVARDDPSVKHVMAMTGQDAETGIAPSRALENVDDVIYINNLIDWRTRYVSPPRKEMDHKGDKSRRVILDPFMFVEEADATYKTSEEAAMADLKKVELYYENPKAKGAMSHQDWYNKHVDQGKAFAGGIYDIKDMGKLTARERILKDAEEMTPEQLREEFQKVNQRRAKQGKPVLPADSSVADLSKARLELEETRVRRLALKNAMIMMAPEIDPPLRKNADGSLSQVPPITREEAFRQWRTQSDDVEASAKRIKENKIDSENEEYKKRFGNPWTSNYDKNGDLELDRLEDGRNLDPSNLQMELTPQTPKTMGGGLGFRAIHPTQHIDSMLGVPALREAHQAKNMGFTQEIRKTKDETKLDLVNRKLTAERDTTNVDNNLQENGVLFDIDERNRVDFTDSEFLADVDVDIEALSKSDILGTSRSPEQLDVMVKDILTKHAEKYGLSDFLGGTQVRTVTRTIEVEETIEGVEEVTEDDLDSLNVGQTKTRARNLGIKGFSSYNSKNINELKNKIREVEKLRKPKPTTRTVTKTITEEIEEPGGEPRWDLIYGHHIWMKNIQAYNKEVADFETKLNREAKAQNLTHEERQLRLSEGIKTLRRKWQENIDKRVEDFETTANNPYDSNAIDPYQNIRTFRTADKDNNRLTFREALLSVSEDERRRSNVGLIDPEGSLQGMRLDESSRFSNPAPQRKDPVGFVKDAEGKVIKAERGEMVEQTGVLNVTGQSTPPAGFATGFRNEAGEYIDIENLSSNQAFSVAITHAKDATMLRNVVAAHMSRINGEDFDIQMLDGVMELTIPGSQVKSLLEEVALIPGADKNVRFNINGVDIISGKIYGHQTRRISSANQSRHILQLSANRYVGDMLLVSGLANGDIKRVVAMHKKMDTRLHETRDFATALNNETQIMLGFLERNGAKDKISSSSFHGTRYIDLKKMWEDTSFRDRVILSTLNSKEVEARKVLNLKPDQPLDLISPYEVTVARMREIQYDLFDPKGQERITSEKISTGEISFPEGFEPMLYKRAGEEFVDFKRLRDKLGIKSQSQFEALIGEKLNIQTITDKSKKIYNKAFLSKSEFRRIGRILVEKNEAFQEGESVLGRSSLDNLKASEGLSDSQILNAKRLAGLSLMGGRSPTLINTDFARAYNIENVDAKTLALAEEILARQRILEHGLDIASGDGVIRHGYGPIVLRVMQDDANIQRKVLDGEELTEADYQQLYQAWLDYEPGRPGSVERTALEDKGSIRDGESRAGLKARIDQGVGLAKRIMDENKTDPDTGKTLNEPFYTGEYPDKLADHGGGPGDAVYFMNKNNFNAISEDHAAINLQFESLIKHGTLTVREVKMLRAVLSQMEGKMLKNLSFVQDKNIRDAVAKIVETEGIDAPNFGGRSPAGFIETSKTGVALHLLKGRLGRELTAVDVILHEIAHASQVRLYDEGFAEWHVTDGLLKNPEAPKLIESLTLAMNNGVKDGKTIRQIEFYQQNPDEFMAALFSYNMQARTFKDRLTLEKAYEAGDEIVEGSGNVIRRILQQMINYSYRKIIHMRDAFLRLDPSYRAQLDAMTDVLLGKGQMPMRDLGDKPQLMFNTGNADKASELADLKRLRQEYISGGAHEDFIEEVTAQIVELENELAKGLMPAEFTNPEVLPSGAARTLAEQRMADSVRNGVLDFEELINQDPRLAMAFLSKHVLPFMKRGKYADRSGRTVDINELYSRNHNDQFLGKAEKRTKREGVKAILDSVGLLGANTEHTINSQVELKSGDARFMLVQMLAELLDNHALASESTFNGSPLASFSQIADGMNRDLNVEMTMMHDDLRSAFFRREESKSRAGRSRILNQTWRNAGERSEQLDNVEQLAGRSLVPGQIGEEAKAKIEDFKNSDNIHDRTVGEILEKMANRMRDNSLYVKNIAIRANVLKGVTADLTGHIPLKLRLDKQQLIKNKGTTYQEWANRVGELYKRKMSNALDAEEGTIQSIDTMTLVASGLIPIENASKGTYINDPRKLYEHLLALSKESDPLVDSKVLMSLEKNDFFKEKRDLHKALLNNESTMPSELALILTDRGKEVYRNRVASFDDLNDYEKTFFLAVESNLTKNGPPAMRMNGNTVFDGTADIRQFKYSQRTIGAGGTRFDSGDADYFVVSEIFNDPNIAGLLDFNPVVLSSGLARGVATEAADSLNFNRVVGNVEVGVDPEKPEKTRAVGMKNLNGRTILKVLEKYTEQVDMPTEVKEQLEKSIQFFKQGRQTVLGYRQSFEKSGDLFFDTVNQIASPLTLIQFGTNLPVTFIAETLSSLIPTIGSKTMLKPVRLGSLIGASLVRGLTPIQRNRFLRQMTASLDTLRNESLSKANINLEMDVRSHELGRPDESYISRTGRAITGFIGKPAQAMLNVNKGMAARIAHEDLIRFTANGSVKRLIDELRVIKNETQTRELETLSEPVTDIKADNEKRMRESQRRLKQAAKKSGVSYVVAQELQKAGLLENDVYDLIEHLILEGDAQSTRILDLEGNFKTAREKGKKADALFRMATLGDKSRGERGKLFAQARKLQKEAELQDKARFALNTFLKLRIDKYNVEPRVFDRPLLNNTGFNALQNIFMSWTRAFHDQKSFVGPARVAAAGGPMALAAAYGMFFIWESVYQSLVEISKGKTQEEVIHEATRDPLFFFMKRAVRAPVVGGSLGSGVMQSIVGNLQDSDLFNAYSGLSLLGRKPYYTNMGVPFNPFSNPAEGAFDRTVQTIEDGIEVLTRNIAPELSAYDGRLTRGDFGDRLINNFTGSNTVIGRILHNAYFKKRTPKEEMDYRRRKQMYYLDLEQRMEPIKRARNKRRMEILEQVEERMRR